MYNVWYPILQKVSLFEGIHKDELDAILQCVGGTIKNVRKGEFALLAGDKVTQIGIVLSGELHIVSECYDGKRSLTASLMPSNLYGEALCCANIERSPVSVVAKKDSSVITLDFSKAIFPCSNSCGFHGKLIENMLRNVARKNIQLQSRMEIMNINSVRGKVLHYLESFVPIQGQNIVIPFNREEMASYLGVERSALSHELSRMKADDLIDYKKNHFFLKICRLPKV